MSFKYKLKMNLISPTPLTPEFYTLPMYKAAIDLEVQFSSSTQSARKLLKYGKIDLIHKKVIEFITKLPLQISVGQGRVKIMKE